MSALFDIAGPATETAQGQGATTEFKLRGIQAAITVTMRGDRAATGSLPLLAHRSEQRVRH